MRPDDDARVVYADIIDRPHHRSALRPHMSLYDRAAPFSAYDALAGYYDMIAEEARTTDSELLLDENERELLDRKLALLAGALDTGLHPVVRFTVFVPDPYKDGGSYRSVTDAVKALDAVGRRIVLESRRSGTGVNETLDVERITAIEGELFER